MLRLSNTTLEGLGAAAAGFALAGLLSLAGLFEVVELKTLDFRFRHLARPEAASRQVIIIAIDEGSLAAQRERLGRWPWPRDVYAYMLEFLRRAGARAVIFDILFPEPQQDAEEFDDAFAQAMAGSKNVVLALLMGDPAGSASPAPARDATSGPLRVPVYGAPILPIEKFRRAARGMGFVNLFADPDGPTRRTRLFLDHGGRRYEALPLVAARLALGAGSIRLDPQGRLWVRGRRLPISGDGTMVLRWYGPEREAFPVIPAAPVLESYLRAREGRPALVPADRFRDKVVLVGATAAGTYDLRVTPFSPMDAGVFIQATALSNILQADALRPRRWGWTHGAALLFALAGGLLMAASFSLWGRSALLAGLGAAYLLLVGVLFQFSGLWLETVTPLASLALSAVGALGVNYVREGRQRRLIKSIFQHYMHPAVVDQLMNEPERVKLGGEKKVLTVFFSDLANFTSFSEKLDPEELVHFLNRYLTGMTNIILECGGYLDKYEGDLIMAVFGAPLEQPDHARRACWAALGNLARLDQLAKEFEAQGYPRLSARIGLNTGPMVVGNMGSESRMDYTVMGDAVNLASRLEGTNKVYATRILIGEATYEGARESIEARPLDRIRVKGKETPVTVYELMGKKGELDEGRAELLRIYEEARRHYLGRRFEEAREGFRRALDLFPEDGPSRLFLERCESLIASPPPEGWDAVLVLQTK